MSVFDDLKKKNSLGNAFRTLPQKNELMSGDGGSKQLSISQNTMRRALGDLKKEKGNRIGDIQQRMQKYSAAIVDDVNKKLEESSLELVCVFDNSYSCTPSVQSTCQSFDQLIQKEKEKGMQTTVSLTLFNDNPQLIYDRVPINQVTPLRYQSFGGTLLYKTLYNQIVMIEMAQKRNKPAHTLVIIMTDGDDNRSADWYLAACRRLITRKQNEGWEFLFLGAMSLESDTVSYGSSLGIPSSNIQHYLAEDTNLNFEAIEAAINDIREIGSITPNWSKIVKENNQKKSSGSASKQIGANSCLRLERKN